MSGRVRVPLKYVHEKHHIIYLEVTRSRISSYVGENYFTQIIVSMWVGTQRPHIEHIYEGGDAPVHKWKIMSVIITDEGPHACKLGSTMAKARRFSLWRVTLSPWECTKCRQCTETRSFCEKSSSTSILAASEYIRLDAIWLSRFLCTCQCSFRKACVSKLLGK